MTLAPFGDRLTEAFNRFGHLCVGIDPHAFLLEKWGQPVTAAGAREFALRVVEACSGRVGVVKPQIAFFELFGSKGYAVLEEVIQTARYHDLIVISDVKRGDVGTSVEAYGQAWLTPNSPLESDAITVSAFQGVRSLSAVYDLAEKTGKGVFTLAATSNPESFGIQTAILGSGPGASHSVSSAIAHEVSARNDLHSDRRIGSMGLVLGATVDFGAYGFAPADLAGTPMPPILAPGFGHQGAEFGQVHDLFGPLAESTLLSASRSILGAGPDHIADAVISSADEVRSVYR